MSTGTYPDNVSSAIPQAMAWRVCPTASDAKWVEEFLSDPDCYLAVPIIRYSYDEVKWMGARSYSFRSLFQGAREESGGRAGACENDGQNAASGSPSIPKQAPTEGTLLQAQYVLAEMKQKENILIATLAALMSNKCDCDTKHTIIPQIRQALVAIASTTRRINMFTRYRYRAIAVSCLPSTSGDPDVEALMETEMASPKSVIDLEHYSESISSFDGQENRNNVVTDMATPSTPTPLKSPNHNGEAGPSISQTAGANYGN